MSQRAIKTPPKTVHGMLVGSNAIGWFTTEYLDETWVTANGLYDLHREPIHAVERTT